MCCSIGRLIQRRTSESSRNPRTWGRTHLPIVRLTLETTCSLGRRPCWVCRTRRTVECVLLKHSFSDFMTKIHHCSVSSTDASCLDILKDVVEPCTDGRQGVVLYILTILQTRTVTSPRVCDRARCLDGQVEARKHSPRLRAEVRHVSVWSVFCAHGLAVVLLVATGYAL